MNMEMRDFPMTVVPALATSHPFAFFPLRTIPAAVYNCAEADNNRLEK